MTALVAALWMIGAGAARHLHYAVELPSAILAGVLVLLRSLIQLVLSLVAAVRMARAGSGSQHSHRWKLMSAILTVVIFLLHFLSFVLPRADAGQRDYCYQYG